jgi:hypothetical protein
MYRKLPQSDEKVIGYHVSGSITDTEVREMHRDVEAGIRRHHKVRLLVDISDMAAPEPGAVLEDLKLTPEFIRDVEKYAIVGDARWQDWATRLTNVVASGEARFFEPPQRDEAWRWVRE